MNILKQLLIYQKNSTLASIYESRFMGVCANFNNTNMYLNLHRGEEVQQWCSHNAIQCQCSGSRGSGFLLVSMLIIIRVAVAPICGICSKVFATNWAVVGDCVGKMVWLNMLQKNVHSWAGHGTNLAPVFPLLPFNLDYVLLEGC